MEEITQRSYGSLYDQLNGERLKASDSQVGGTHYKNLVIQPAEYTTKNGIGHLAGDAIAYLTRYKFKNGKQDLEKAIHSIQLLIEHKYPEA